MFFLKRGRKVHDCSDRAVDVTNEISDYLNRINEDKSISFKIIHAHYHDLRICPGSEISFDRLYEPWRLIGATSSNEVTVQISDGGSSGRFVGEICLDVIMAGVVKGAICHFQIDESLFQQIFDIFIREQSSDFSILIRLSKPLDWSNSVGIDRMEIRRSFPKQQA